MSPLTTIGFFAVLFLSLIGTAVVSIAAYSGARRFLDLARYGKESESALGEWKRR